MICEHCEKRIEDCPCSVSFEEQAKRAEQLHREARDMLRHADALEAYMKSRRPMRLVPNDGDTP